MTVRKPVYDTTPMYLTVSLKQHAENKHNKVCLFYHVVDAGSQGLFPDMERSVVALALFSQSIVVAPLFSPDHSLACHCAPKENPSMH